MTEYHHHHHHTTIVLGHRHTHIPIPIPALILYFYYSYILSFALHQRIMCSSWSCIFIMLMMMMIIYAVLSSIHTYILNELICPIAIYKAWFYRQCFFYQGWLAENHAGTFIVFGCLFDLMAKKCRSFFGHFQ